MSELSKQDRRNGTSPISLGISANELRVLDRLVRAKQMTRSEYIRAAIEAYSGQKIFRPSLRLPRKKLLEMENGGKI